MENNVASTKVCFGIDVGGTTIKVGLFDELGTMIDKWQVPTNRNENGRYILNDLSEFILNVIKDKKISDEDILGIGLGIPGPVRDDGIVIGCVNLGWGIFNAANVLTELTGLKVIVNNDANIAALGEQWQGGGKGFKSTVFITLGTGVGGGIIIDDHILTGSNGAAGEIGHMTVNFEETESCNCGKKGCLEQYASATGIVRLAKKYLSQNSDSTLLNNEKLNTRIIFDHAKAGDKLAIDVVKRACSYLGVALTHVAAVVDPEAFVIGGGVSNAGSILIDYTKEEYENNVMQALRNKDFKLAILGNDAGIYGAAKMVVG